MSDNTQTLIWVDLEMTGLDPRACAIVEIASIVTDSNLNIVAEGPNLVVSQPASVLEKMDNEVRNLHQKSGLLERIKASTTSQHEASAQTLEFWKQYSKKGSSPLCGN